MRTVPAAAATMLAMALSSTELTAVASADHFQHSVVYLTDQTEEQRRSLHRTGFFLGNRGYLLTVIDPKKFTIGSKLYAYTLSGDSSSQVLHTAFVVDLHTVTGIALLRLGKTGYPYKTVLINVDRLGQVHSLAAGSPLDVYYADPNSPYADKRPVKLGVESDDGYFRIEDLAQNWREPMTGAPVFSGDRLIGIVSSATSIHPINHAAGFVTMAESTIIGKDLILEFVQEKAALEGMLSREQKQQWSQFIDALEETRKNTAVIPNIDTRQIGQSTQGYFLEFRFEKPIRLGYDPVRILASGWPQISYPLQPGKPESRKRMSAREIRDKHPDPVFRYSYPDETQDLSTRLLLNKLRDEIAKALNLNEAQKEDLLIESMMLRLEWEVGPAATSAQQPKPKKHERDDLILPVQVRQ